MCGIHGLINLDTTYFSDGSKFISEGFVAGSLRGMDSSGVFQLDKQFKPFMHKDTKSGSNFIVEGVTKSFINDAARSPLTLCHVRAATVGGVKKDNAHPFLVNDAAGKRLIGVHNGTLRNWQGKKGAKDYVVDSNWAFHHIAEEGIDAFEDFQGAYCFAWWDENNPSKFQMVRNSERPMHFMISKDKKKMIFASEALMVAWLAERNKIAVEPEVYSLEEGKLYTFDLAAKEISFLKGSDDLARFSSRYTVGTSATTGQSSIYNDSDWDEYYGRYGYTGRGGGLSYDDDGVPNHGLTFISSLAILLDDAAAKLNEFVEEIVVNDDDTQASLELVPKQLPAIEAANNDMVLPANTYSASTASTEERNAAKSLGVMGELQWMQGVAYDPEQCSVLGFIEDFVAGEGRVQYDAELRATTASIADRSYINNKSKFGKPGDWVVVIGATIDKITNKRLFVVAPLNDEGRRHMMKKAN